METSSLPNFPDDGFTVTAAEPWVLQKMQIVSQYVTSFVGAVSGRVDEIIVVDLYSGSGMYSLGSKRQLFPGLPLTALSLKLPINKFVFCEKDPNQLKALKIRTNKYFKDKNVILLEGKPQELVDKLAMYVPVDKEYYKSAVLCVCDPFSIDMPFATISRLAAQGFNFIIPFNFALNDRINYRHYLKSNYDKLDRFLGIGGAGRLKSNIDNNLQFYKHVVRIYQSNMLALGLNEAISVYKIDSGLFEIPSYYIGLFSKQFSSKEVQENVEASHKIQYNLFNP